MSSPIAGMATSILERVLEAAQSRIATAGLPEGSVRVPQGRRHIYLTRLAGAWWSKDLEPQEVWALVWLHAITRCAPPFDWNNPDDRYEVDGIARAVLGWRQEPRP